LEGARRFFAAKEMMFIDRSFVGVGARYRKSLLAGTALAALALPPAVVLTVATAATVAVFAATPVFAQGGNGGPRGEGATGGTDSATGVGGTGADGAGGGGGAGVIGGTGGNGGSGIGGGTAGTANGGNGGNGTAPSAGGGGGGNGFVGSTVPGATVLGGQGGTGADGSIGPQVDAGGGGAGGWGVVIVDTGNLGSLGAGNTATGGQGGAGGNGTGFVSGGDGGSGGIGLALTAASPTLNVNANVTGGAGGAGGTASGGSGSNGEGGAGGIGISGDSPSLTITSGITVSGGAGGPGGNNAQFEGQAGGGAGGAGIGLTGGTISNAGTIQGGNGGAGGTGGNFSGPGAGGVGVIGSGITVINSGTISGGLANGGAGAQANAINFAGGANTLTINGGTLTGGIGDNGGGSITFNQAAAQSLSNVISGNGSIIQNGVGTLTLSSANTYTGGTTLTAGTLAIGNNAALGTGTVTFNGGTLDGGGRLIANNVVVNSTGGTIAGSLEINGNITDGSGGAGSALNITGVTFLNGTNTYSAATSIAAGGALQVGTSGSLSANSDYAVNGSLDLRAGTSSTIRSLSGAGTVQAFTLGGTTTLTIGPSSGTTTFSGTITDGSASMAIVKTGAGTQIFSGVNNYSGTTTVNGGILQVDGSIASSLTTVNANATLTGVGTVGNTTVAANGTFAPGSGTPGTSMAVTGSLALASGALYAIALNPTTASSATVTGAANLGGARVSATFANGSYISKQYTILTAGSLGNTTFNATVANTNLPSNFRDTLSYDPTHAYLDLALNFTPPTGPGFGSGLNQNQQAVANTLVNFFNTTGGIPMAFGALSPAGLTQVSGETATGSQQTTFNAMGQFMEVMTDPFVAGRGDGPSAGRGANGYADEANAYAGKRKPSDALAAIYTKAPAPVQTFEARWSTWIAGYGGSQTTDGNAALGSNSTTSSVYATAVGADYRFSADTIAGFALAGGGTNFNMVGSGYGRSDLFQAGAFIRHTVGAAYISGALAYGWQDITTDRIVTAAGADHLRAEFNANAFSGRVEGGYRFISPWIGGVGITPYAAGQFTTFDLPAYAESALSGANTFTLAYDAKDVTDTRSELGFRTDKSFAMQTAILTLRSRFAWAHDFNPDRSIAATFQTLPGASFVVNGAAQASDSALTTASAELKWTNNWSVAATFEGEFSSVTNSYAGKGVVRYAW
jgi:autotransporter-associated beta strand protein